MAKTNLIFPAFSSRFVDFATIEVVLFCIDHRLLQMAFFVFTKVGNGRAKAGFRVLLKYFEINKIFRCSNLFRYI